VHSCQKLAHPSQRIRYAIACENSIWVQKIPSTLKVALGGAMAFPTAVNDAVSKKTITAPVSESEIKAAFQALQSKGVTGAITDDVLRAFLQYVSIQFDTNASTESINQKLMSYLQPYNGANKVCNLVLTDAYSDVYVDVQCPDDEGGVIVILMKGAVPGVNQSYTMTCTVLWD
jgi:hypothetical protein